MKIVVLDCYAQVPEMIEMADDCYLLEDSIWQLNLEAGDLLQCTSEWGTECYNVLIVESADGGGVGHGPRLAWLEAAR